MKKKVLIVAIVAVIIVLIAVALILLINKRGEKEVAKEFAEIINDDAKLKDFFDKKLNYKYAYAYDNIERKDAPEKELTEEFERIAKEVSDKDLELFKEECIENNIALYNLLSIEKMSFKKISDKKKVKDLPIVTYYTATYDADMEGENKEEELAFLYYKDNLIMVIPAEYLAIDAYINETDNDYGEPAEVEAEAKEVGELDLSEDEINSFNNYFADYDAVIVDGTELKSLLDIVIALNEEHIGDG